MRDILVGVVIIAIVVIIGDFIYSEQNTCLRGEAGHVGEFTKCGLLKNEFDISIYIIDRYW